MKKMFVKPLAKRYALNTKEHIVSSIQFLDGTFGISFHTIHLVAGEPATEKEGCYDILNNSFPIPKEPYTTINFGVHNRTINNVMANWEDFNDWYQDTKFENYNITTCHD